LLLIGLLASCREEAGVVFLEGTAHDWGVVEANTILKAKFPFENRSSVTLRATDAKTSCGCTDVRSVPAEVAPGESGYVEVELDTGPGGRTHVDAALAFVGHEHRERLVFDVSFQVKHSARFEPPTLTIAKLPDDGVLPAAMRLDMRGVDEATARDVVSKIRSEKPWLRTELARLEQDANGVWYAWLTANIRADAEWLGGTSRIEAPWGGGTVKASLTVTR